MQLHRSDCLSAFWPTRQELHVPSSHFSSAIYSTDALWKEKVNIVTVQYTITHHKRLTIFFLPVFLPWFSSSLSLPHSIKCRAFLFVCSCSALPADLGPDFPKADINITGHCNGVIFMEAPEEVTWLWLVPWGPGVSIKLVVLTPITINEVEKLRK